MKRTAHTLSHRLVLCLLLLALAAPTASTASENTLAEIAKICGPAGIDLGQWLGARPALPADSGLASLSGTWALAGSVGEAALDEGYLASTQVVAGKVLVERIELDGVVVYRSATGLAEGGQQVSLWAGDTCRQLAGGLSTADGESATRKMADQAGSVSVTYTRTTRSSAPTGEKDTGGACAPGQLYKPGTTNKWCKNGTCLSNGKCP